MTSQSQKALGDHLRRRIPSSAEEQIALERVWSDIQHEGDAVPAYVEADLQVRPERTRRLALAAAAVLVLAVAVGTAILWPRGDAALYRVVDGVVQAGGTIRTNGGGAQLALVDGSHVEMRSQSELSLERADDGLRIRLNEGGIIVNAAPQRSGHLYVQTKDVTVSVVGTVFLVNATEEGSRVAVIEGEVHVQQGVIEKRLLPGEQVATSPSMTSPPVREAISWSRNSVALLTLLHQSAVIPPALAPQNPTEPRDVFEEASVRPSNPANPPGRAGGQGGMSILPSGCGGSYPIQVDPARFAVAGTTLHTLITWAYGTGPINYLSCRTTSALNLVTGGPGWVRTEPWDVEAVIPAGALNYTPQQLSRGEAPRFRTMLRALLADRFKVVMRRDSRETAAYALTAEKGAPRLTLPAERFPAGIDDPNWQQLRDGLDIDLGLLGVKNAPIADAIPYLVLEVGRPVEDRTGLTGPVSFRVTYRPLNYGGRFTLTGPPIFTALQNQAGLKLEEIKSTVDAWVLQSAERPSPN